MNKKKGFTLIELLAIIVILAIIAVITVPIILGIIDNAKKGSVINSAYGYKDAVNKWYVSKLQTDSGATLNGTYSVSDGYLDGQEIPLSGDKPSSGYLSYSNNVLTSGCLTIGDYKITFEDGEVKSSEKGVCEEPLTHPIRIISGTKGDLQTGDVVRIGRSDDFYVLRSDNSEGGKTVMFTKYILNSSDVQDPDSEYKVKFSDSAYWVDSDVQYISPYSEKMGSESTQYRTYVYDSNSLVYDHIENYVDYLKNIVSVDITGRLYKIGDEDGEFDFTYSKIANQTLGYGYWGGEAYITTMWARVSPNYIIDARTGDRISNGYTSLQAIRPVIEIPTSEIY